MAFSGNSPRIDIAETLLPLPDSPTKATVEFTGMSKEMPFTARKGSCLRSMRKRTSRSRTWRSGVWFGSVISFLRHPRVGGGPIDWIPDGSGMTSLSISFATSLEFRIEGVAQRIGQQREG